LYPLQGMGMCILGSKCGRRALLQPHTVLLVTRSDPQCHGMQPEVCRHWQHVWEWSWFRCCNASNSHHPLGGACGMHVVGNSPAGWLYLRHRVFFRHVSYCEGTLQKALYHAATG